MSVSEFDLIRQYFTKATGARADVLLGIGDDCALLNPPSDRCLAVSMDTLVEGRHFLTGTDEHGAKVAEAAAARGLRGTIFVGIEDWTAATAQTSVTNLNEAGLSIHHIVMEDKGHEYPDDFDDVLREAVKRIYQ